jgi:hypothetical protein
MSYLLVGALALALLYWGRRPNLFLKHADWRVASALMSIGVFAAALFVGVRGGWGKAIVLVVIGLALAASARWPRAVRPSAVGMSLEEARAMLGVGPQATAADIQAAYSRLIQRVHPDRGGAVGLAIQLNMARDRLLKR